MSRVYIRFSYENFAKLFFWALSIIRALLFVCLCKVLRRFQLKFSQFLDGGDRFKTYCLWLFCSIFARMLISQDVLQFLMNLYKPPFTYSMWGSICWYLNAKSMQIQILLELYPVSTLCSWVELSLSNSRRWSYSVYDDLFAMRP